MGDVGEKMANEIQPTGEGAACRESGERTAPDRRVVRTRKAIRQAFLTLMQETEYQKITITGIAREADIDRKTFYLHYQSVEDLANEIVQDEADRDRAHMPGLPREQRRRRERGRPVQTAFAGAGAPT